ncbi:fibronectin/fibrinogen-binding protein [Paenibacillus rhizovicinus]|uniref:Rqc2 homolog RqcH n=1 Tax=Paenibacillus rhizovicinus TaxID=2704463 RepID=A0A6C0P7F5_9BACL|nr:NFACT RNA binding domain-containing protein [Paenibacillus rhizovicinus]QHW34389.1 fibronectin/fibrinogen-binding protein [Paenibacillus rhizovicinus]
MALDGIVTRAIADELQACVGARIHKIHQPSPHDLVLQIRGGRNPGRLLLSANPTYPRVHWTEQTFVNPMEAPMFCMLMRKHCEGAVIEAVRQVGNERIIHLDVRQRDELGDTFQKRIIIELMGRHSNIILLDATTETIHDGIHHVTPSISSYRVIMPGTSYIAPPEQGKHDPFAVNGEREFTAALHGAGSLLLNPPMPDEDSIHFGTAPKPVPAESLTPDKLIVAAFSGMSPLLAKEIAYRAAAANPNEKLPNGLDEIQRTGEMLWPFFRDMMTPFRSGSYEPQIVALAGGNGKSAFSVTPLTHLKGETAAFETVSACLEAFYGDKAQRDTVKQRVSDLIRFLQNERGKNEKKLEKLEESLREAQDADKFRILGELLTASLHQIQRGDTTVELANYYEEEMPLITIPLDPQLTPSQNAQRLFKKYAKFRNSQVFVTEQMGLAEQEIQYLASLLQQLDSASLADIEEIRDELAEQGYMRQREKRGAKKKKSKQPALLCYTSSEGLPIFVGKNNTQNDFLTNKVAGPNDTWLHTKDIPGSHVVIRGANFNDRTLEEAAMLAAQFSQARSSSMVPVDYTLIRHVKKPSGAKPGFVIYDHQKTLFITPDEQRLKDLPSQIKA